VKVLKVYLDDVRICPAGWTLAKNVREAIRLLENNIVTDLSLDFDLGIVYCRACMFSSADEPCFGESGEELCDCDCHVSEPTGIELLKWIRDNNRWPSNEPQIHSANVVGAQQMQFFIRDYGPYPVGP